MGDVLSRILWGPTKENVLNLPYPLEGMMPRRRPRPGSMHDVAPSGTRDAWIIGRDYKLPVTFRWITRKPQLAPYPVGSPWSGPLGMQAFLDWCDEGNSFRFVPDVAWPAFYVDDCYLDDPHSIEPELEEEDGSLRAQAVISHPTVDLAMVRDRGLMFEYVPGASLAGLGGTFSRADATTCATYIDANGGVRTVAANVLRDSHYIAGVRHTLLEPSRTNLFINSEDISGATLNNATVSANADAAPDDTVTMDRLIESTANGTHSFSRPITVIADAVYAFSVFVKAGSRTRVALKLYDAASNTHSVLQKFNLSTGAVDGSAGTSGTGAFVRASIVAVSGGYRITLVGSIGSAVTSVRAEAMLLDASGATTYTGDGSSYASFWGVQFEDNARFATSYIKTSGTAVTRAADELYFSLSWLPQAGSIYVDAVSLGIGYGSGSARVFQVSNVAGATPRLTIENNSTNNGTVYASHHNGSAEVVSTSGTHAVDARVEYLVTLTPSGATQMTDAYNGGGGTARTQSGANALATAWSTPTVLHVGGVAGSGKPGLALRAIRVAFGVRTLAEAQAQ